MFSSSALGGPRRRRQEAAPLAVMIYPPRRLRLDRGPRDGRPRRPASRAKYFTELRKRARDKRDKAIAQARKDYSETLVRIAALEQDLLGKERELVVRRLRKSRNAEPALYVRVGVAVEKRRFEGMTLREAMRATLAERPLNATELAVAMLDAGYETTQTPQAFRCAVRVELRSRKGAR